VVFLVNNIVTNFKLVIFVHKYILGNKNKITLCLNKYLKNMKKIVQSTILFSLLFFFFNVSIAQTIIYSEDFEGTHSWTLNVPTGANGSDPNFFIVSDNEGGILPPGCSQASNGNKTLHITSVFNPTGGAAYDGGGLCGILFCPQTNYRAESPTFSTIGLTNISVTFDFIGKGDGLIDNASFWYNTGNGWEQLVDSLKSPVCTGGNGQWTNKNIPLPVSAENKPNVQIGFNWTNNDDGISSDPSFAVNNIIVSYIDCHLSVITDPLNKTININNNAQFVVSSSDTNTLFQWQSDLGNGFENLNNSSQYIGSTNDTLIVSNVTMSNNNQTFRCIISTNLCSDTSNVAVLSVNNNLEINNFSNNYLFSVFPNPVQNILNLKVNSDLIGMTYIVIDNSGKIVLTGKINSEKTNIELVNLTGGIYILSVGENLKQIFKVIKE
jgi:hypothetical protein